MPTCRELSKCGVFSETRSGSEERTTLRKSSGDDVDYVVDDGDDKHF